MRYLVLLLVLLVASCQEPEAVVKPDDLIPEEKMVQVLADVHLLEAAISIRSQNPRMPMNLSRDPSIPVMNENGKKTLPYYDVFQKHGLTREQYEKTMKWYTSNPEELNSIYDQVLVELTRRQSELQAAKPAVK